MAIEEMLIKDNVHPKQCSFKTMTIKKSASLSSDITPR